MKWLMFASMMLAGFMTTQPAAAQSVCPDNFQAFAGTTEPLNCTCSAEAADRGSVYGMDIYTSDSSICRAAVHAGAIPATGGAVTVTPLPGQKAYAGVTRNGISSSNYSTWDASFGFDAAAATPTVPAVAPSAPATAAAPAAAAKPLAKMAKICPDNFVAFRDTTDPLTCGCSAEAIERGAVYGMDVYTDDSSVCEAAVHAGVIDAKGGNVTLSAQPGRESYPGVTRNGISSSNYNSWDGSFAFSAGEAALAETPAPIPPPGTISASVCPDNFVAFRGTEKLLACGCTAEATERGAVYGMDVYTDDSSVCAAAVHAGVISDKGGNIGVTPLPGRKAYPGVTRNGMTSSNYGTWDGSFSVALAAPEAAVPQTAPVQKPIAQALKETGEVQLYINFAFNSAGLLDNAVPVLDELLGALQGDPALKLALIGHTDAVGSADYNLSLSGKRAQSVAQWLIEHGIAASRLQASGRGLSEPIADNATEYGRAVNRRVQALRLP